MLQFKDHVLLERVFGNTGWVYHRTKDNPSEYDIVKYGIKPSSNESAMYGKGLYTCYDLDQQMKPNMRRYGSYILKGKIDLNGFAILDSDVYWLANPKGNFQKHLEKIGTNIESVKDKSPYTSEIAQNIWKKCKQNGYNGIVFTGRSDGKVAVIWNRRNFIPFQYTEDEGKNWKKLNPDISSIKRPHDPEYDKDDEAIKFSKILKELKEKEEIDSLNLPDYNGVVKLKKLKKCGGGIDASNATTIDLSNLQTCGEFINANNATTLDLSNLQTCGGFINANNATTLDLSNLQTCGEFINASMATTLDLSNLQKCEEDIDARSVTTLDLSNLQTCGGNIVAHNATTLDLSNLQTCGRDIYAPRATTLDLSNLQECGGNINATNATTLDLSNLQTCGGYINASMATTLDLSNLKRFIRGFIVANSATTLDLRNLRECGGTIDASNAEKIIIQKELMNRLTLFPKDCEIIHPEETDQIKVNEDVTFKKYLMLKESLVQIPLDTAYEIFKNEYDKSTGKSWTYDKFMGRARNWEFYGDEKGYVAIRRQRSGLVKLVGMAGDNRSKLKGINDLISMKMPLWGMVSKDIKDIAVRRGMREPNFLERQVLKRSIPPEVLGGAEILEYQRDGGIKIQYPDVGVVVKFLVGTPEYYAKLREMFGDKVKEKILG
jgi:hypothetical protein